MQIKRNWIDLFIVICSVRQEEFDSLSKGDIFKSFYSQLDEIQKYHKKFPGLVEKPVVCWTDS